MEMPELRARRAYLLSQRRHSTTRGGRWSQKKGAALWSAHVVEHMLSALQAFAHAYTKEPGLGALSRPRESLRIPCAHRTRVPSGAVSRQVQSLGGSSLHIQAGCFLYYRSLSSMHGEGAAILIWHPHLRTIFLSSKAPFDVKDIPAPPLPAAIPITTTVST